MMYKMVVHKWWHPVLKGDKQDGVVMAGRA